MSKEMDFPTWAIPATYTVSGYVLSLGETLPIAMDALNERYHDGKEVIFTTMVRHLGETSDRIHGLVVPPKTTVIDIHRLNEAIVMDLDNPNSLTN